MQGFDWFLVMFTKIRLWPYIRFLQSWPWNEQEKDIYGANKIGKYIYQEIYKQMQSTLYKKIFTNYSICYFQGTYILVYTSPVTFD